jgi:hypothetical protein
MNKMLKLSACLAALAMSATAFAGAVGGDGAAAVPEPGTLGLLVAGLAVAVAVRRIGRK